MRGLLIENGRILTLDGAESTLTPGFVRIEGDVICEVGVGSPIEVRDSDVLDANGAIIMPGLLNAHTHSPETLARGCVDRIVFEEWVGRIWPALDRLTPVQIRVAVLLGCAEMLRSGTTAVVDHFRQTPLTPEAVEAAVSAYREAGMRCALALMLRDRHLPPWVGERGSDPLEVCRWVFERYGNGSGLVTFMLGPSAPHRCTDGLLEAVAELSEDRGVFVQTHVDETRTQRREAAGIYGQSSVRHLAGLRLLNERVSLAHCVWVDADDLDLLAQHDATVVHNPISNLRLASGVAPVRDMLVRGIRVVLGSDGAASNDSQNMFEAMKVASLLPGAAATCHDRPTAHDILTMTTGDAGRRFGMDMIGAIAQGRKADLIVVEANDARLHPLHDLQRQLVFGGAGLRVRHVVIGGRVVMHDGKITTFDEAALFEEADVVAGQLT